MSQTRLIVGLGNPGGEYEGTRHNLGAMVVRHLAHRGGLRFRLSSFTNGLAAEQTVGEKKILYLLPQTHMNHSGMAVRQAVDKKEADPGDILIVCDDLSLDFGRMRIRPCGSHGGHNGLRSVIERLETEVFPRLRLGIRAPRPDHGGSAPAQNMVDYVLGVFTPQERRCLDGFIEEAAECCLVWAAEGVQKAMDQFNRKANISGE